MFASRGNHLAATLPHFDPRNGETDAATLELAPLEETSGSPLSTTDEQESP